MTSDIEIGLSVQTDSGAERAARQLRDIREEQDRLSRAFRAGNIDADRFTGELKALEADARKLERALDSLEQPRNIDIRTDNFDQVSRDVGLAGDVQSNLGAIGGIAGAAGLPGAGGIAVGGEFVALIEELPRLKTAVQGLPATIGAAAGALGTNTAGLIGSIGALGVAAGAVAVAVNRVSNQIQESANNLGRALGARLEVNRLIAQDATVEEVTEKIREYQIEQETLRKSIAELEGSTGTLSESFNEALASANPLARAILGMATPLIMVASKFEGLNNVLERVDIPFIDNDPGEILKRYRDDLDAANKSVGALQGAIDSGNISRREATEAEEEFRSVVDGATNAVFGLDDNIRQLQNALQSGNLTSRERIAVEKQIENLTQKQTDAYEKSKKAAEEALEVENELAESRRRGTFDEGRNVRVFGNFFGRGDKSPPANQASNSNEDLQRANDARRDALERQNGIVRDFNSARVDAERALQNELKEIDRQAARDARRAARNRDFAAIFDLTEQASAERAEASIRANEQLNERRIQAQRELDLLKSKFSQESQILNDGYQQAVNQTQQFVNGVNQAMSQLAGPDGIRRVVRGELQAIAGS